MAITTEQQRVDLEHYRSLIDCLPLDTIEYAFAYGSGAVAQANEKAAEKMVDFILVSNDALRFHEDNLKRNPRHYSWIRLLGAPKLEAMQTKWGARLYFNTRVVSRGRIIKYGIISLDDIQMDLLDWRWLYVAGRLHKPVLEVLPIAHASLREALLENRRSALHASLLQLPDSFSFDDLFTRIVRLSYDGDFRMHIGEDKMKISKLVSGARSDLMGVYLPLLSGDVKLHVGADGRIQQDTSTPAVYHRLNLLPSGVLNHLSNFYRRRDLKERDMEEVIFSMAHRHDISQRVSGAVASIVRASVPSQTVKNALTAGARKSLIYSLSKIVKMLRSLR